ncbi:MAG TPA: hypothetical protein VHA33_29265 [Candidatus Angelobacter sp.]|jgi:hypothetical protein|nr:hypothetical protein [Candidatus Angelobacter sp.]
MAYVRTNFVLPTITGARGTILPPAFVPGLCRIDRVRFAQIPQVRARAGQMPSVFRVRRANPRLGFDWGSFANQGLQTVGQIFGGKGSSGGGSKQQKEASPAPAQDAGSGIGGTLKAVPWWGWGLGALALGIAVSR